MIDKLIFQALSEYNVINTLTEQDNTPYIIFNSRSEFQYTRDKAYLENIQVIFLIITDTLEEGDALESQVIQKISLMLKNNGMILTQRASEKSIEEEKSVIAIDISINKFL